MAQADAIAAAFKQLHQSGKPSLLANVWDIVSARVVARLPSCKALATTSFAVAHASGTEDNDMTLGTNLAAVKDIAAVAKEFDKPLTVDIQDGYGEKLEDAITGLLDLDVSGANLEDFDITNQQMFTKEDAVKRIQRVMNVTTSRRVPDFVLNARVDTLIHGGDFDDVLARGRAYLGAGATTVFVLPGPQREIGPEDIKQMVQAFDGKLNIGWNPAGALTIKELAGLGVARVSVGPSIHMMAMDLITKQAEQIMAANNK